MQKLAGLQSPDQAREATEVVFSVLKQAIPPEDVRDTAGELPPPLRDLWLETNV